MREFLSRTERVRRIGKKLPESMQKELNDQEKVKIEECLIYSRFRIACTTVTVGSGLHTVLFPVQTIETFKYGIGESMANAGFPSSFLATRSDTNLFKGGKTNNGQIVGIERVSLMLTGRNDAEVLRRLFDNLYVSFGIAGQARARHLGLPHFLGARGGLVGGGESLLLQPNLQDQRSAMPGFVQNGHAGVDAGWDLGEVIVWGPESRQGINSDVHADVELSRAATLTATARTEDVAGEQIAPFTPPVAQTAVSDNFGTFLEGFMIYEGLSMEGLAIV